MADSISFRRVWNGHPLNNSESAPCRHLVTKDGAIRGLPIFANQCAIRMGVALREAGISMAQVGSPRVCWHHAKDEMHILNAQELANGLLRGGIAGLGPVEKYIGADATFFYPKIFGRRGIIFFKDYWARSVEVSGPDGTKQWVKEPNATGDHIDVWNGYRTTAAWLMEWFSWLGYYSNYRESREIWFWEIK